MKKFTQKLSWMSLAIVIGVALLNVGCEKNGSSPEMEKLDLNQESQSGLSNSWEVYQSLKSVNDMNSIMGGKVIEKDDELDLMTGPAQVQLKFSKMEKNVVELAQSAKNESRMIGDSLIIFIDYTDPVSGISVRKALYYDQITGKARYYETIYQFPPQIEIEYDSTEIRADLNFTLQDTTDDKLLSVYQLTNFKSGFNVEKKEGQALVTDYGPANEVTGATLHNEVFYGMQTELEKLTQDFEINPDKSGTIAQQLDYHDNTFAQVTVNLHADYAGDFSEIWRDGTTANGTFDRVEDDNHGAFEKTINFVSGVLQKLEQSADIILDPTDSTQTIMLSENRYFTNGNVDSCRLNIDEFYEGDLLKTNLELWKNDGSSAELLVSHYPEFDEVEGYFIDSQGYYILVAATFYSDGSGDMNLKVYESELAYLNGDPPQLIITIHFNPDGSGNGQLTKNNEKYQIQVAPNGTMTVVDAQGRTENVDGY
jgi:hypothetical protein